MDVLKSAMGRLVCAERVTCLLTAHLAALWVDVIQGVGSLLKTLLRKLLGSEITLDIFVTQRYYGQMDSLVSG